VRKEHECAGDCFIGACWKRKGVCVRGVSAKDTKKMSLNEAVGDLKFD
jgi:hypothetical protein